MKMKVLTDIEDIQRATERLRGILTGISIDKILRDDEIEALNDWLNMHETLHQLEPFRSTVLLIEGCLADNRIDEGEREEIIEWCSEFDIRFSLPKEMTAAIRRLHGVLNGIGIDGTINDEEVWGLHGWLQNYTVLKNHWPFSGTWTLIERILEDGKVTEEEKKELLDFCRRFVETNKGSTPLSVDEGINAADDADNPILQSFENLCDRTSDIAFEGKRFCYTGLLRFGTRKTVEDMAQSLGSISEKRVVPDLDYLVIGARSSPCWAYSSYGLKVRKVLEFRRMGRHITFLHEDDFIAQANQANAQV